MKPINHAGLPEGHGQLCKGHGAKLLDTSETAHPAITTITGYTAGKLSPGKEVHQLREQ
jgi:hypothetical protein